MQVLEILGLIFEPPSGVCPSVEDLVLCDLFRSIDLRELRGPCFSVSKGNLISILHISYIYLLTFADNQAEPQPFHIEPAARCEEASMRIAGQLVQ